MSTLILIATSSVTGVIGAAAMFIPAKRLRDDAKTFMERGEETFDKAEHLAGEVERTRNMPWHYADEHVTGELIAVETHDLPALSAEAYEDERAADEGDDRQGVGAWLLETLIRLCSDLYDRIAAAWQSWRTRDEVGNGDGIGAVLAASGYEVRTDEEIAAEIAELTGEPVAVEVAEIREVDGRKQVRAAHWNDGTAVHSTVYVGRRRKAGA